MNVSICSKSIQNLVDERFELVSLVFRFAGKDDYSDKLTDYHNRLETDFDPHRKHPIVKYAQSLPFGYDAIFKFAIHIQKIDNHFEFIEDIGSLVQDGRWKHKTAEKLLKYLNKFYCDTSFAQFFIEQLPFYENITRQYIEDVHSKINFDWFRDYVNVGNLRTVLSPSTNGGFGVTVNDIFIYALVSCDGYSEKDISLPIHEFCHNFANPIADRWYKENKLFRKWCKGSIDEDKMPYYSNGEIMSYEYVTRSFCILYEAKQGNDTEHLIEKEKQNGFPFIEDVYKMVMGEHGKYDFKHKDSRGLSV